MKIDLERLCLEATINEECRTNFEGFLMMESWKKSLYYFKKNRQSSNAYIIPEGVQNYTGEKIECLKGTYLLEIQNDSSKDFESLLTDIFFSSKNLGFIAGSGLGVILGSIASLAFKQGWMFLASIISGGITGNYIVDHKQKKNINLAYNFITNQALRSSSQNYEYSIINYAVNYL